MPQRVSRMACARESPSIGGLQNYGKPTKHERATPRAADVTTARPHNMLTSGISRERRAGEPSVPVVLVISRSPDTAR